MQYIYGRKLLIEPTKIDQDWIKFAVECNRFELLLFGITVWFLIFIGGSVSEFYKTTLAQVLDHNGRQTLPTQAHPQAHVVSADFHNNQSPPRRESQPNKQKHLVSKQLLSIFCPLFADQESRSGGMLQSVGT